jgi:hypothetical protein
MTLVDSGFRNPGWMSRDCLTVYGDRLPTLFRSRDECATWQVFTQTFGSAVQGVRELDNGSLLVSLSQSGGTPGSLWLSTDYASAGLAATFTKVLDAGAGGVGPSSFFSADWGMSIYQAIVCVCEYGLKNPPTDGARYAYLSTNSGATWSQIFDLGLTVGAHTHGIAYDPWWSCIWLVNGDGAGNRAIRVSFDNGSTWQLVSTAYQPVSILPLEHCILFLQDSVPNGVVRIPRTSGRTAPTVEVALTIDSAASLTMIRGMPYRHRPGQPVLLPFFPNVANKGSELWMTWDGYTFTQLWQDTATGVTEQGLYRVIGPTAAGNLFGQSNDGRQASYSRLSLTAPAPKLIFV